MAERAVRGSLEMRVADTEGGWRLSDRAWVCDGQDFHEASCAWVHDDTAWQGLLSCAPQLTMTAAVEDHDTVLVGWNAPNAIQIGVYIDDKIDHLDSNEIGQRRTNSYLLPGYTHTVKVTAEYPGGSMQEATAEITMDPVPVPTNVRPTGATTSTVTISWSPVDVGPNGFYKVYTNLDTPLAETTQTSWTRTGLPADTVAPMYVRAWYSRSPAIYSDKSALAEPMPRTDAKFPAGTHYFRATYAESYSHGERGWMGRSAGKMWHGDGGTWGAYGNRITYFFGYVSESNGKSLSAYFNTGQPVTYTAMRIYMYRSNTSHGIASPQTCRWGMHGHSSKPGGNPGYPPSGYYDNGALNRGQGGWIGLPKSWAGHLAANSSYRGMTWGGTPYYSSGAGYMYGTTDLSYMGRLEIKTG